MNAPRDTATGIVRTLVNAGHVAYFAGGCVRDELLGHTPEDYDVATDATPEQVERLFKRTKAVGKSFGVVLVRASRIDTEVATFREESGYSDKRRPDTVRFADAQADAARRDFTINALFIDPLDTSERSEGRVIDYVGGERDLEARLLRAVGDPGARLNEDHLRALRAVRFASRLGFKIDDDTQRAIRAHASELEGVSRERVGAELRRMLAHPARARAVRLMQSLALDAPVLHDGHAPDAPTHALDALPEHASVTDALGAWTLDRIEHRGETLSASEIAPIVRRLRGALVLGNDETETLRDVLSGVVTYSADWSDATVAQRKRWGASRWARTAIELISTRDPERADALRHDLEALAKTPSGLAPAPLLDGEHLIKAGFSPGPLFGKWLDRIYDEQLEGRVSTREEALERVRTWARQGPATE